MNSPLGLSQGLSSSMKRKKHQQFYSNKANRQKNYSPEIVHIRKKNASPSIMNSSSDGGGSSMERQVAQQYKIG